MAKDKKIIHILPTNDLATDIAQTIATWLIYNSSVSGSIGVQENMINYPVKAFLVCHQNDWSDATFEETHPYLSYRRIDFYLQKNDKQKYYFEFKQAKKDTEGETEFERIYDDLIRLAICKKKNTENKCYFLMFGDIESYQNFFINAKKENLEYSDWFVFSTENGFVEKNISPKSIIITPKEPTQQSNNLYANFTNNYKVRKEEEDKIDELVPDKIITRLEWTNYINPQESQTIPNIVGVWEILLENSEENTFETTSNKKNLTAFIDASTGVTTTQL